MSNKITPFLMFNHDIGEVINFYSSIFKNSKITSTSPGPDGKTMSGTIVIEGQEFMLFNGGSHFSFTEGFSLFVSCKSQEEVDFYWEKLTADGGEESMCGWLKDRFGLSWQIIPDALGEMLGDPDREKAGRAMNAMFQMKKIDIKALTQAYKGE